jgi:hypothetical protein
MKCARIAIAVGILLFIAGCGGSVATSSPDEIMDFEKNTANYEGKALAMPLHYTGKSIPKSDFVESTVNVPFQAIGTAADGTPYNYFIIIGVPKGLYNSGLDDGDDVTVEFECALGKLDDGNVATAIH